MKTLQNYTLSPSPSESKRPFPDYLPNKSNKSNKSYWPHSPHSPYWSYWPPPPKKNNRVKIWGFCRYLLILRRQTDCRDPVAGLCGGAAVK